MSGPLILKNARLRDLIRVRGWRNDLSVTQHLKHPRQTGVLEHLRWCLGVVAWQREVVFAGWNEDGEMTGVVRLRQRDCSPSEWLVGVIVDPSERGHGYGRCLVVGARNYAFDFLDCEALIAEVHVENRASLRTFAAAGFDKIRDRGDVFVNFVSNRPSLNDAGA